MSFEPDQYPHVDQQPYVPPNRRRKWPWIVAIVVLVLLGSGGWFAWSNFGSLLQLVAHGSSEGSTGAADGQGLADVLASQEKTGEDLESLNKTVSSQQEQLKALLDQVSALTSKVDSLQRPAAPAPTVPPVVAAPPPAPAGVVRPRKPPRAAKPAGAISVGGAPLNGGTQ